MPDNIPIPIYVATHLAAAICSNSVHTNDFREEGIKGVANTAADIFLVLREEIIKRIKDGSLK